MILKIINFFVQLTFPITLSTASFIKVCAGTWSHEVSSRKTQTSTGGWSEENVSTWLKIIFKNPLHYCTDTKWEKERGRSKWTTRTGLPGELPHKHMVRMLLTSHSSCQYSWYLGQRYRPNHGQLHANNTRRTFFISLNLLNSTCSVCNTGFSV